MGYNHHDPTTTTIKDRNEVPFLTTLCTFYKQLFMSLRCFQAPPTNMFVNEAKHFSLCSAQNSYWRRKRSISSWPRVYLHNCRAHRGTTPPVRSLVSIRNYDASFEKFRNLPTFTCLVTWYWLNIHKLLMQNWHTWNRNANQKHENKVNFAPKEEWIV